MNASPGSHTRSSAQSEDALVLVARRREQGEEPPARHRVGPWSPVIPVELVPANVGGDTRRLQSWRYSRRGPRRPRFVKIGRFVRYRAADPKRFSRRAYKNVRELRDGLRKSRLSRRVTLACKPSSCCLLRHCSQIQHDTQSRRCKAAHRSSPVEPNRIPSLPGIRWCPPASSKMSCSTRWEHLCCSRGRHRNRSERYRRNQPAPLDRLLRRHRQRGSRSRQTKLAYALVQPISQILQRGARHR